MENVATLRYAPEKDRPDLIRSDTYRKLINQIELHHRRVSAIVEGVEPQGDDAHLRFCFTGVRQYGRHYICSVWPEHRMQVRYRFAREDAFRHLFRGWVFSGLEEKDPARLDYDWSSNDRAGRIHYKFFEKDPHLPHRPYLFTCHDRQFSCEGQDEQAILNYHLPMIARRWEEGKPLIDAAIDDADSLEKLLCLWEALRSFHPEKAREKRGA